MEERLGNRGCPNGFGMERAVDGVGGGCPLLGKGSGEGEVGRGSSKGDPHFQRRSDQRMGGRGVAGDRLDCCLEIERLGFG